MDYWNCGIMGQVKMVFHFVVKPNIPSLHYSNIPFGQHLIASFNFLEIHFTSPVSNSG